MTLVTSLRQLGPPDDRLGYSTRRLRAVFDPPQWNRFTLWMEGQTVVMGEDGEAVYYADDVRRFLAGEAIID